MYYYFIVHLLRIILPLIFIQLLSQNYESSITTSWLKFLLFFQFSMQMTESGVSLSGPILFQKFGSIKSLLNKILLYQVVIGVVVFIIFLIFNPSMINMIAILAGIFQGLSLTWVLRFKEKHKIWFFSEAIFRVLLYASLVIGIFFHVDLLFFSSTLLAFSFVWFAVVFTYVSRNYIVSKDFRFKSFSILSQGLLLKYFANFMYPGLIIFGESFFVYEQLLVLEIDKIVQGFRGFFGPIIDYLFPKAIKRRNSIKVKLAILLVGGGLSAGLMIFLPFIIKFLFNIETERTFFMMIYSLVPLLISITHIFGTLGLVVDDKIKSYLKIFALAIVSASIFIYFNNLAGYVIMPYIVLSLGLLMHKLIVKPFNKKELEQK